MPYTQQEKLSIARKGMQIARRQLRDATDPGAIIALKKLVQAKQAMVRKYLPVNL